MKLLKLTLTTLILTFTFTSFAQGNLLSEVPETKEEFVDSEPQVLATIEWLENTPFSKDDTKRKKQSALLLMWLTNSPTVTIELNSFIMPYIKKNPDLLITFMGGWTKFALENEYSKDVFQGSLAGTRSIIKMYEAGGLKKDKKLKKLVAIHKSGGLEDWVQDQLSE